MRFAVRVEVRLRAGIADPEGATIERALPALGFDDVRHVTAGRSFRFEVDATDEAGARARAEELAHRLLANPVIERSGIELVEPTEVAPEGELAPEAAVRGALS
jgi:phosphoribosylformylglycinamidine synthase